MITLITIIKEGYPLVFLVDRQGDTPEEKKQIDWIRATLKEVTAKQGIAFKEPGSPINN